MRDPDALISTDDLAGRLVQPGLRIYNCTTYLEPPGSRLGRSLQAGCRLEELLRWRRHDDPLQVLFDRLDCGE